MTVEHTRLQSQSATENRALAFSDGVVVSKDLNAEPWRRDDPRRARRAAKGERSQLVPWNRFDESAGGYFP